MKMILKILLFATAILALYRLPGVFLSLITLHWIAAFWKLLHAAFWAAVCAGLFILDRRSAPPLEKP